MNTFFAKAVLTGLAVSTAMLCAWPAEAHNISTRYRTWQPPKISLDLSSGQTVTPFCEGKYEAVAKDLNRDNILGNINLYRLHSGLPRLQSQSYESSSYKYGHHTRKETRFRDATLLLDRSQSHLSLGAETDYLRVLDLNTISGRSLDWWLQEELPKRGDYGYGCRAHEYPKQVGEEKFCGSVSGETTKTNSAFDWLTTHHQMENARRSWRGAGHLHKDEVTKIFDHVDTQVALRPGLNIWMMQYANHVVFERELPDAVTRMARAAVADIMSCQASPTEYGIIAAGDLGLPRDFLPKGLAERRAQRDIHTLTYKAMRDGNGLDETYHAQLRAMVDRLEKKTWAASFLFLSAPDLESAMAIYQETLAQIKAQPQSQYYRHSRGSAGLVNLVFSLPTEDIPDAFKPMRLAQALSEGKFDVGNAVVQDVYDDSKLGLEKEIAKARARVERNADSPSRYVNQAKFDLAKLETRYARFELDRIENADIPNGLKLSLIAILSNASHNVNVHHRDIYPEQSSAEFLDIYFRRQLFPGTIWGQRWRGRSYYSIPKKYLDGSQTGGEAFNLPSLRKNDGSAEVGFAAIVDWDKLQQFGDEKRLTRTLATNLFNWIDTASPEQRAEYAVLMAPALYDFIRISRHENAGTYDGKPAQQRAFERLHRYYGETPSAKKTRVWWASRRKHGNAPL